jgi:hypothetical protein
MQYSFAEISLERENHYLESKIRHWRNRRQAERHDGHWQQAEASGQAPLQIGGSEGPICCCADQISGPAQDRPGQAPRQAGREEGNFADPPSRFASVTNCALAVLARAARVIERSQKRMHPPSGAPLRPGELYRVTLARPERHNLPPMFPARFVEKRPRYDFHNGHFAGWQAIFEMPMPTGSAGRTFGLPLDSFSVESLGELPRNQVWY